MKSKKKIFYWSPHINTQVATVKSVLNSAIGLAKFNKNEFDIHVINVFGEWNEHRDLLNANNVKVIDINLFKIQLPINGFVLSRIFYILVSILSVLKIIKLVKAHKPDFFVAHLIVAPALIVSRFLSSKTKFILRVSGYPVLNTFRFYMWKILGKNLFAITSPTISTMINLEKKKIFPINKLHLLRDPIFRIDDFLKLRENKTNKIFGNNKKIILSVGRLTKQKNFGFLIENFSKISNSFPDYVLLIIGSGEQKIELEKKIKNLKMQEKIKIMNYQKNIYRYYLNANLFVLVSLWEDPGFVIFEAAINNLTVLSSDCPNGPKEFLKDEICGYSFKSNDYKNFRDKFIFVLKNLNSIETKKKKINAKKYCKAYTMYNHSKVFAEIFNYS